MTRWIAFALLLVTSPLAAQTAMPPMETQSPVSAPDAPPPQAAVRAPAIVRVRFKTGLGDIVMALEKERAPVTTAYILKHVDQKRFDGANFYRAYKITPDGRLGLVQGGVMDPKKQLPPVPHEPTTKTGLSHVDGAVSLARLAPGTATANFFIILGDLQSLDADPKATGDNQGYAVFGRVIEGMDVVRRILDAPISPSKGAGAMKGQMIAAPVPILGVARVP